jgi:ABC-2 type transport system permease protein
MQAYATSLIVRVLAARPCRAGGVRIVPHTRMRFNPTLESVNLFVPGPHRPPADRGRRAHDGHLALAREGAGHARGAARSRLCGRGRSSWGRCSPTWCSAAQRRERPSGRVAGFGVPFRGQRAPAPGRSLLFIVVSLALGVLIAAVTSSQRAAMMGRSWGSCCRRCFCRDDLSRSRACRLAPAISTWCPGTWFILISRGIMLKGVGLATCGRRP